VPPRMSFPGVDLGQFPGVLVLEARGDPGIQNNLLRQPQVSVVEEGGMPVKALDFLDLLPRLSLRLYPR
jgi:hypothetical protein